MALPETYVDATADETLVLIRGGACRLWTVIANNNDGANEYIQCFDAASTGAVTLGTTPPSFILPIEGNTVTDYEFVQGVFFPNGLVIAVTTTSTGSTGPTQPAEISLTWS